MSAAEMGVTHLPESDAVARPADVAPGGVAGLSPARRLTALPPAFEPGPMGVLQPVDAPEAPVDLTAVPIAIPPHVVAAIARAAVEAYKEAERQRRNAEWRAYYRVNGEQVRARRKEAREQRRVEQAQHRLLR